MTRTFHIRTFGCQMNEHDSERLAGLLIADGLEPTDDVEHADVVVLNTCCIRENADNKLYGYLGWLKSLRDSRPGMQIAVGGCLAQKDREMVRRRAGHVDVVFGTHNLARAPALLRQATVTGPSSRSSTRPRPRTRGVLPLALSAARELPYTAWVTIQTGCDNSCAFCIVPQVRGPEVSRPFDDIVAEVATWRPGGHRGDAARTERQLLRTRPHPPTPAVRRAPAGGGGRGRHPAGALHEPAPKDLRPETIAAMAETPAVCEHLHLPLQSGSDRVLSAMRRGYRAERYLARLSAARAAIDDLAVTTDIIVGFPGETDDDFERTLEVAAEAGYDSAYTFIFSPRPGTRAAAMTASFVPDDVVAERFERLRVVVERSALARHRARIGRVEEVIVEGPSTRDPDVLTGRTRQNKLVHFAPPRRRTVPGPGAYAEVRVTDAAPHHLRGRAGARHRAGAPAHPHPRLGTVGPVSRVPGRRAARSRARGAGGADGVGEVRAGPGPGAPATRRRAGVGRLDVRVPGHGHRHGQAERGRAGRGSLPPPGPGRPRRGVHGAPVPGRRRAPRSRTSSAVGDGPCSSAGPGSTCAPWSTT